MVGTYLIYPSVSTTIFQTMRCEMFEAPRFEGDDYVISYLRVDMRLECGRGEPGKTFNWDPQYLTMYWYAAGCIVLYPIGEGSAAALCQSYI